MDFQRPPTLRDLGDFLLTASQSRWLSPEEVYLLLSFPSKDLGIPSLQYPPPIIKDGTLCLYEDGTFCKQDNINWAKKKGQAKLQETYSTLKIRGVEIIKAVYIRGVDNANFRRRIYKLNTTDRNTTVVHYRECPDDERADKTPLHAMVHYFLHRNILPSSNSCVNSLPGVSSAMTIHSQGISRDDENADLYLNEMLCDLADDANETQTQYLSCGDVNGIQAEMIDIVDFAPSLLRDNDMQRKLLICISHYAFSHQWQMVLTTNDKIVYAPIESVQPGVLKLIVPNLTPGLWKLYIINEEGRKISNTSWEQLTIIEDDPRTTLGKRLHSITSNTSRIPHSYYQMHQDADNNIYSDQNQHFHGIKSMPMSSSLPVSQNDDFVRENKIRIVEKLGSMKSALLGDDSWDKIRSPMMLRHPNTPGNSFAITSLPESLPYVTSEVLSESNTSNAQNANCASDTAISSAGVDGNGAVEWLDDTQLSTLSNRELESVIDRYIMAVVKELVQLAAVDDDLKAEMDSLDANGYSLFHYCCLYNLTSLIPVLIARGVQLNQTTVTGATALHLAVAAGHIAVVQLLLECGVDANLFDDDGLSAYDIATSMGREDIACLLYPLSSVSVCGPNSSSTKAITPKKIRSTSLRAQSIGSPELETGESEKSSQSSQRLFHDAFATLSLTDKCALSISLSQRTPKPHQIQSSNNNTPNVPQVHACEQSFAPSNSSKYNDNSSCCSINSHSNANHGVDTVMMDALSDLDMSYVDLLMTSEHPSPVVPPPSAEMSTNICNTKTLSLHSFPDNFPPVNHSNNYKISHFATAGYAISDDRSPPTSASTTTAASTLPRAASHTSIVGPTNNNSNSTTALLVTDDFSDIQSVISESDKESLDKAMSLMGHQELVQVEEEVRKIQNNVRGWLLRKNYVNLREAARSLQLAWREKRNNKLGHPHHSSATQPSSSPIPPNGNSQSHHSSPRINLAKSSSSVPSSFNAPTITPSSANNCMAAAMSNNIQQTFILPGSHQSILVDEDERNNVEERAAATLQAATRRMIARKSFANLHKQTMASITIQRNLVRWWTRHSGGNVSLSQNDLNSSVNNTSNVGNNDSRPTYNIKNTGINSSAMDVF